MRPATTVLFEGYAVLVVLAVLFVGARHGRRRDVVVLAIGLLAWLAYVGTLSILGVVRDATLKPPGAAYILLPVAFGVACLARSAAGLRLALAVPAALVIGLQAFRIGVELLLHRLYVDGLVPRLMTYEGGNVDIAIGLSAPLFAWLATRGRAGRRWAIAWNFMGLAALANIAVRAIGTAPGALHFIPSEVPNLAVGLFPFTYIAGFFAPLALVGHVLTIRSLLAGSKPEAGGCFANAPRAPAGAPPLA